MKTVKKKPTQKASQKPKPKARATKPKKTAKHEAKPIAPQAKTSEPPIRLARFDELQALAVNGSTLARLLDTSPQAVALMVRQGKIKRNADRTFPLASTVTEVVKLQRLHSGKGGRPKEEGSETDYWRAARLREQTMEGRRQIAEELVEAIIRAWRQIAEAWLERCTPKARDEVRRLFGSFDEIARAACADAAAEEEEEEEDNDIEVEEE